MTEQTIKEFFNDRIQCVPDRPATNFPSIVSSVSIKRDKMYAFVEFFAATDADIAMCMDGIECQGTPFKIRRHSDFTPDPKNPPQKYNIPGIISTQVENDQNKIFLGPLPVNLTDDDVKKLVTSFGPLRAFSLVKDIKSGQSKGFAFFSYQDTSVTDIAREGLNGISIGGKEVVCRRAILPGSNGTLKKPGVVNYDVLCVVPPLLECALPPPASRVLILQNIAPKEELTDEELLSEIQAECGKYGEVKGVTAHLDRIFVEYAAVESAIAASGALSGRRFDGRIVIVSFLSEYEWSHKKLN